MHQRSICQCPPCIQTDIARDELDDLSKSAVDSARRAHAKARIAMCGGSCSEPVIAGVVRRARRA